ncbi:hypothetical protein C8J57DRAFT_1721614 [Mycena rebaudengoi]|nr:hypothetical protein C8J57DRAFT_1721614 [Mycena rebaudengoi]
MDPNNPPVIPDASIGVDQSFNNSVTSSGYPDNSVAQHQPQPVDIAALIAANQELTNQLNQMNLGYNTHVKAEMDAFRAAVRDDFFAVQAQRDAAQAEVAATIARLELLEGAAQRTRDPRVRPAQSQPAPTPATPSKARSGHAKSTAKATAAKQAPATPNRAQKSRPSGPDPSPKLPRSSLQTSRASANPPRPSPNPLGSRANAGRGSASSSKSKNGSSNDTKKGSPRRLAEHQMLKGDIDKAAQSFKNTFQCHLRFIAGCLESALAPSSASPAVVQQFELRFEGLTVTELKRLGQIGSPIIKPSEVKLGLSVQEYVRSKNRIVRAFFQLEEAAILHVKAYFAKLGIVTWAVDFSQSPYSMYNSAMRMCAIDTFRFMIAGTYYDFLHPDTSYIKDSGLLVRLYDHFIHRYMFDKWKAEIRMPGGNELTAERNKFSQYRIRLHTSRDSYLKASKVPKRLALLFTAKATSDDESTPQGPRALAREERSEPADHIIRAVDRLIVEDLNADGKTRQANSRNRRKVPAFGERNPSHFEEIPKAMPIQYYDPDWFNNRPPQARAKIAPKLIVVFPPGSKDFFSRRGDNTMSIAQLTDKYGEAVFANYDLDFGTGDAEASTEGVDDADDEGDGDIVGSEDSDEEAGSSDGSSVASFLDDEDTSDAEQDDPMSGREEEEGTWDGQADFAAAYDVSMGELENQIFGDSESDSETSP